MYLSICSQRRNLDNPLKWKVFNAPTFDYSEISVCNCSLQVN
uniref:Uncharacterized protein LOC101314719 isoform X1 n=1 Tax=Rhizophora mucronata TaxID=61149 RepID=A0A2P2MBT4_RHIMU